MPDINDFEKAFPPADSYDDGMGSAQMLGCAILALLLAFALVVVGVLYCYYLG